MVHEVVYGQKNRVAAEHAGPGIAHDGPDLLSHVRPEAMHRALGTGSLPFLERALLETAVGIDQESGTISAQLVASMLPRQ